MIDHYFSHFLCFIKDGFDDNNLSTHIIWPVCLDDSVWFLFETGRKCMDQDQKKEEERETGKDPNK